MNATARPSVEQSTDQRGRIVWVLFLAGPVIWISHFMAVYLAADAVCNVGHRDSEVAGLHPVAWLTLAATAAAVAATLACAVAAYNYWKKRRDPNPDWLAGHELNQGLALAGVLLGGVFALSILFVGLPAAFLEAC